MSHAPWKNILVHVFHPTDVQNKNRSSAIHLTLTPIRSGIYPLRTQTQCSFYVSLVSPVHILLDIYGECSKHTLCVPTEPKKGKEGRKEHLTKQNRNPPWYGVRDNDLTGFRMSVVDSVSTKEEGGRNNLTAVHKHLYTNSRNRKLKLRLSVWVPNL